MLICCKGKLSYLVEMEIVRNVRLSEVPSAGCPHNVTTTFVTFPYSDFCHPTFVTPTFVIADFCHPTYVTRLLSPDFCHPTFVTRFLSPDFCHPDFCHTNPITQIFGGFGEKVRVTKVGVTTVG